MKSSGFEENVQRPAPRKRRRAKKHVAEERHDVGLENMFGKPEYLEKKLFETKEKNMSQEEGV